MILENIANTFGKRNKSIVLSYRALRRLIGILGIALPSINVGGGLLFADTQVLPSISMYYYSNMRDFLVGLLFLIGLFLLTYKGEKVLDLVVSSISGFFGLGIAIFPCQGTLDSTTGIGIFNLEAAFSDLLHFICAAAFFILLALNSLFLFTRNNSGRRTISPEKKKRNVIYIVCGIVMSVSLLGILVCSLIFSESQMSDYKVVLIGETLALFAFGISWLIKGETLFREHRCPERIDAAAGNSISAAMK